jgi:N,N-dimethylformamidase beta subunit-like protein
MATTGSIGTARGRHTDPPQTRGSRAIAPLLFVATLAGLILAAARPQPVSAGPCDPPIANPVVCENSKPGNPSSEWDIGGSGDSSIQGFATDISVNKGEVVRFKIKTSATAYRLDIYRLGYYGGNGARKVTTVLPSATLPQSQPNCQTNASVGLVDCGNWAVSASWTVPSTAVSGVYFAYFERTDSAALGDNNIAIFVVRDDTRHSAILFQTSDTTWQAYNRYGGNSLYFGNPVGRAYKVSYNRPLADGGQENELWNAEYPMIRWLESNGYDVSYSTGIDTDRRGAELLEHKAFLSVSHDEY